MLVTLSKARLKSSICLCLMLTLPWKIYAAQNSLQNEEKAWRFLKGVSLASFPCRFRMKSQLHILASTPLSFFISLSHPAASLPPILSQHLPLFIHHPLLPFISHVSTYTFFFLCNAAPAFLHSADFTQLSMLTWNVMFPFLLWNCQLSLRMLSAHLPQCWNPLCSSESQHLICPHSESKQRVYTTIK